MRDTAAKLDERQGMSMRYTCLAGAAYADNALKISATRTCAKLRESDKSTGRRAASQVPVTAGGAFAG